MTNAPKNNTAAPMPEKAPKTARHSTEATLPVDCAAKTNPDLKASEMLEKVLCGFVPAAALEWKLYEVVPTAEQIRELQDVARYWKNRRANLKYFCTPMNAAWIFATLDNLVSEIQKTGIFSFSAPERIYLFLLNLNFGYAEIIGSSNLRRSVLARLDALYDVDPEIFISIQEAFVDAWRSSEDMSRIKIHALNESAREQQECAPYTGIIDTAE